MPTVTIVGGAGAVGRVAARTLAQIGPFDHVVIADRDLAGARQVVAGIGAPHVEARAVDAGDPAGLEAAFAGSRVVLNCSGPFYRYALPVLQASLAAGCDYVDVCDDVDATLSLLEQDQAVRDAGRIALIGMGNSPGVTNLLARFAADQLLDEVEAVDIYHAHGGEAFEGAGVVAHRLHGMTMDIPMYLDGALRTVRFFEPEGLALRTTVPLHLVGDEVPVYPYPHPEQITIPRHIRCRRVTNRGTVLPDDYFALTTEVARLGLTSREPLHVGDLAIEPRDVAIAFLLKRRDEILAAASFGAQRGCTMVEVRGLRRGEPRAYRFSMASSDQALGEGTGIPAAMGAMRVGEGAVEARGVLPPEGAIDPTAFLGLVPAVLQTRAGQGSFEGIRVEQVHADGRVELLDLPI